MAVLDSAVTCTAMEGAMLSRRSFLQAGTVAAVTGIASQAVAQSAISHSSAPPSIQGLSSRRDEAKPISIEERAARQEKARRLMRENRVDAILMTEGTSLNYFSGIR